MAKEIGRTGQSKVRSDNVGVYGLGSATGTMDGTDPRKYPGAESATRSALHNPNTVNAPGYNQAPVTGPKPRPSPTAPMTPVGRAFQQGYQQGKGGGTGHGGGTPKAAASSTGPKPRPKAATAAKPKARASVAPKTSTPPKARPKAAEAAPKGIMGKIGKALANNKANIQKKAVDRMKASSQKG